MLFSYLCNQPVSYDYLAIRILEKTVVFVNIKYFVSLVYYAEVCNRLAWLISTSLRRSNTALFKMSQQWRAVGNTVFDLSPKPPFQQRKVKHVTACPSDRFLTI